MLDTLGQYKILDLVGTGRSGEVYRARDTRIGRTVAIRMLGAELAADPGRRRRLLDCARLAAVVSHPNIAALYEVGEDAGRPFLVYEFAAGELLSATIGGQPLSVRRPHGRDHCRHTEGKPYAGVIDGLLPAELAPIVSKALGMVVDETYESPAAIAAELRAVSAVLDGRAAAAPLADRRVVGRQAKRSSSGWIWIALAGALTASAAVWYLA